jgi:long-chain acyl-CoA synthetase
MANLTKFISESAKHFGDKPLFVQDDITVPFDEFFLKVKRLAGALAAKEIGPGKRVILLAHNSPEWLISFYAIIYAGASAVPVNPGLAPNEVRSIVEDCGPALCIVQEMLLPLIEGADAPVCPLGADGSPWHALLAGYSPLGRPVEVKEDDPAIIFYTSGTTGKPKGVMLSHAGMDFDTRMFAAHLRISPKDRTIVVGSMAFMLHLVLNALSSMRAGATVVLLGRFRPDDALRVIERHRVTLLMGVPTVYIMMLNWLEEGNSADVSSIRWAVSAGAAFPAALYERARHVLGIPVFDLWGLTECAPVTSYFPGIDQEGRPDSCGKPLPGCGIRVVGPDLKDLPVDEVGEVLLKSPAMMVGYFQNAEATAETIVDGWVRSGDLGRVDEDGYLYIVGRQKDMIIRAGSNIYPVEIEQVLYTHDAVAECAVVGMSDATFGEVVRAFVVLKEGHVADLEALLDHCRSSLAEYKLPTLLQVVQTLPKGPTGKVLRRELKLVPVLAVESVRAAS